MKTEYQQQIIDRLRRLREERNFSQAFVAKCLGISPGQLGNIESYKRGHKYTLKQIYELSILLNFPLQNIFTDNQSSISDDVEDLIKQIIRYQDDKEKN